MVIETTFTARVKGLRERYSRGAAMVAPVEVGEGVVSRGAGAMGYGPSSRAKGRWYEGDGARNKVSFQPIPIKPTSPQDRGLLKSAPVARGRG